MTMNYKAFLQHRESAAELAAFAEHSDPRGVNQSERYYQAAQHEIAALDNASPYMKYMFGEALISAINLLIQGDAAHEAQELYCKVIDAQQKEHGRIPRLAAETLATVGRMIEAAIDEIADQQ